ncbi:MAG: cytochrome c-type biogenesis protein CcmH [Limnohabitans sp.]|nr:cytochrome c-type biogenesis protein CcmH [Limnohabitans sp.]
MKWILLCCLLLAPAVRAADALPVAEDPQVEKRLVVIAEELRCLVCQNESLASSHAELAEDLRREVRKLIREEKTDTEIKTYLVERYGDFVLYRPQVKPLTWPLWFGPFFMLLVAVWGLWRYLRLRKNALGQAQASPHHDLNQTATHKD